MTEKRFHKFMLQSDDVTIHFGVKDSKTDKWYHTVDNQTARVLTDLLNKLFDENEQLKQSYKEFEDDTQSTFNAMNKKQDELYRKNFKLKEENEQLKSEIEKLKYELTEIKQCKEDNYNITDGLW